MLRSSDKIFCIKDKAMKAFNRFRKAAVSSWLFYLGDSMKFLTILLIGAALITSACGSEKTANEKIFRYGTTAYGIAMENAGMDAHESYQGWSAIRYGVGETLFKFNDAMQPQPWLAEKYEFINDNTVKITLRDDVYFSNGNKMTGEAVKACLVDLINRHNRAREDLKLTAITAEGQTLTLTSSAKAPALINYLCDPYGCIMEITGGEHGSQTISGTGPYIVQSQTPKEVVLVPNQNYWGGKPGLDKIIVSSITDGNTLALALQNGEIDAAQGLPYAALPLFKDDPAYKISSAATSRTFHAAFNFNTPALQDVRVRRAVSLCMDRETFSRVQLLNNGIPALSPFPPNLPFGGGTAQNRNLQEARRLLAEAGWTDSDGDGYTDKNGETLTLRWLTYTSRQELPLLAEAAQSWLKEAGIRLEINPTDGYNDYLQRGEWDIYAKAFVTAPTGDAQYYFTTHLGTSPYNNGAYRSSTTESLAAQLGSEFNPDARSRLAMQINSQLAEDAAFMYIAHLKMSLVMKNNVHNFTAHPCDYYEITKDLTID